MKILMVSLGTRGDMEPFLAIGGMLKKKGQQVICAFPEQFRDLAEDAGMEFESMGPEYIDMLNSTEGKAFMGGGSSWLAKIIAIWKLAAKSTEMNKKFIYRQYELVEREKPDRVLYNGKAIYPFIWELDNRGKTIFITPVPYIHRVKGHTHVGFHSNFGPLLNRLTYTVADFGLITTVKTSAGWLKTHRKITRKEIAQALPSNRAIYTISPSLFPRPDYWPDNLQVLGYPERDMEVNWQPDNDLQLFLESHQKILFVTFGSMTSPEPEKKTKIILDILERHRIPAIINTASGGLVKPAGYSSDLIRFIDRIPYDWIFPRVYAVIHHGGSGTTHLALKHGCASMVIPYIIDQYVWNNLVRDLGAGPAGIEISKITGKNLEPGILDLFHNPSYREKAQEIAAGMKKEDFRDKLYRVIVGDAG